jgi:hypothetical protein
VALLHVPVVSGVHVPPPHVLLLLQGSWQMEPMSAPPSACDRLTQQ